MSLNECLPTGDIQIQDINDMPYFLIPMYDLDIEIPPLEEGKNYEEEYHQCLDEHHQLTKVLQDLLFEREELINSIQQTEPTPAKRPKSYNEFGRGRRKAKDIARFFICKACGKSYGSEGSLKQHTKIKHTN